MAEPYKGRGRGQALFQELHAQRAQQVQSSKESSSEPSPGSCVAPSFASSATERSTKTVARGFARLLLKETGPSTSHGVGRGKNLLNIIGRTAQEQIQPVKEQVKEVTKKIAECTISSQAPLVEKNKYIADVKDTPPVIKKGESGTPCEVTTNFIYLKFEENKVFEYEVTYEPDQDYKNLRFKLLNEHKQHFKTKAFDGTTLYLPHKLPQQTTQLVSTNPYDNSKVNISIIFRRTCRLSEIIHIFNVIFKNIMGDLQLVNIRKSKNQYYNERAAIQIPQHNLEIWPGYVTAVDEYKGGLLLVLDTTSSILQSQTVLSFIKDMVQRKGANSKWAIAKTIIGCSVMTTYNKRLFRIDDVDEHMTPRSTFEKMENGKLVKISFIDYYKNNYGIDITDWDQPLLISRNTKRLPGSEEAIDFIICLVPELCRFTGLTDDQKNNFNLLKDIAMYTRMTPNQRHAAYKKYIQDVLGNETAKSRLAGWGLSLDQQTMNIPARVLSSPRINFGNYASVESNTGWSAKLAENGVMQSVDISRWVILFRGRDKNVTTHFLKVLKRCCGPMGIKVLNPELICLTNDCKDSSYLAALRKCITPNLQLVIAVCSTQRDDLYSDIKKICCAECPVPSQIINARTLMNDQRILTVTQNILLQINCKLGGTLWSIAIPFKSIMIVGIDTYHDLCKKKRSVCAFIASYNNTMTQWYSKVVFQEQGQEIVDSLKDCLNSALEQYLRFNGGLPGRIIIYRDGVSEGQLKLIQQYEIPQMQTCFVRGTEYKPKLTYIIVQKRINTRIFLKTNGGFQNPNPGTVVDDYINKRDWYDFLIVSQKIRFGSVIPTHYVVLHDDSGMTPDQCQQLTYKMCHLYYNWPGTVKVPAPCQYAHKLAYLVGENIQEPPSAILSDKLFFL